MLRLRQSRDVVAQQVENHEVFRRGFLVVGSSLAMLCFFGRSPSGAVPFIGRVRSCKPSSSKIVQVKMTTGCFQGTQQSGVKDIDSAYQLRKWRIARPDSLCVQVLGLIGLIGTKARSCCLCTGRSEVDLIGLSGGDALAYFGDIGVKLRRVMLLSVDRWFGCADWPVASSQFQSRFLSNKRSELKRTACNIRCALNSSSTRALIDFG